MSDYNIETNEFNTESASGGIPTEAAPEPHPTNTQNNDNYAQQHPPPYFPKINDFLNLLAQHLHSNAPQSGPPNISKGAPSAGPHNTQQNHYQDQDRFVHRPRPHREEYDHYYRPPPQKRRRYDTRSDYEYDRYNPYSSYAESNSDAGSGTSKESSQEEDHNLSGNNGSPKGCFQESGEIYLYFDDSIHSKVNPNQIQWGNNLINVKWHPKFTSAFCQIKNATPLHSPYVCPQTGHQTFLTYFGLQTCPEVSPGQKRRCFATNYDPDSGLGKTLDFLKSKEDTINQALFLGDQEAANKAMSGPAFSTVSMANFTSGWAFTKSEYLEWARHTHLDLEQVTNALELDSTAKVPKELLDEEANAKTELVNYMSGLRLLELLDEKFHSNPSTSSVVRAITRHFLPNLKSFTLKWMSAKMEVRKSVLENRTNTSARQLLKSSLWHPNVFPNEPLDRLKDKGPQNCIKSMLDLTTPRSRAWVPKTFNNQMKRVRHEKRRRPTEDTYEYGSPSSSKRPFRKHFTKEANKGKGNKFKKDSRRSRYKSSGKKESQEETKGQSYSPKNSNFKSNSKFKKAKGADKK